MAGVKAFSEAKTSAAKCFTDQRLIVRRHAQGCKVQPICSSTELKQAGALRFSDLLVFCEFGKSLVLLVHIGLH